MAQTNFRALAAAVLALIAAPVLAQTFSDGYNFLKAIRERDGAKVDQIASSPNSATIINTREASTGEGALHIVTRVRDLTWLRYLLSHGARPDIQSNDGTTALMLAAQIGWQDGAEALLARRASVNLANNRGETPLIYAVQRNDIAMVRFLMANGADPDMSDSVAGYSAIDYATQDRRRSAILQVLRAPRGQASDAATTTVGPPAPSPQPASQPRP